MLIHHQIRIEVFYVNLISIASFITSDSDCITSYTYHEASLHHAIPIAVR